MKILFNTYLGAFYRPGGGEVVMLKLQRALIKRGHEVKLVNHHLDDLDEYDLIHEFSIVSWRKWLFYKMNDIRFVLTPTCWPRIEMTDLLKARLKYFLKGLFSKASKLERIQDYLSFPQLILPTTKLEQARMKKAYHTLSNQTFEVIPNGVDLPVDITNLKNKYERDYCLYVGTIAPNKNLLMAIKSSIQLGIELVVVGDFKQEYREYYDKCYSYKDKGIHFLGRVDDVVELASYYHYAKCTLVLSDFETCSLVALESGTYGTPVLITKYGGTKEVFKDHVTYCDGSNQAEVEDSLRSILKENRKNDTFREFVLMNYQWDVIAQKVEMLYQRVISKDA
jgi:glycosyltransferase involved in cell wall biosynthesis